MQTFVKYLMKGQYNELHESIQKALTTSDKKSYDYFQLYLYDIYAFLSEGNYSRAKEKLDAIKNEIMNRSEIELHIYYYSLLSRYYYRVGELHNAVTHVETACSLLKKYRHAIPYPHYPVLYSELNNLKGLMEMENGNLNAALDYLMNSYHTRKTLKDDYSLINSINNLGIVYLSLGKYENARIYFENTLKQARKVGYVAGEIMVLNNLGVLYQTIGELDKALQYHELALQRKIETHQHTDLHLSFYNIARIFEQKGLIKDAKTYYLKSFELLQKSLENDPISTSRILYRLTLLELNQDNINDAQKYLDQLATMAKKHNVYSIQYRQRMAQAIMWAKSDDVKIKIRGLKLFDELLNDKMIEKEFTIQIQIYYVETLFELLLIGNETFINENEILDKIEKILGELNYYYQTQNAYQVLVETLILQAKFYFIKNNLKRAQFIIDQAWISAIEFGFTQLIKKIEEERNILRIQELKPLTEQEKQIESIKKRITQSKILTYLEELKKTI